MTLVDDAVKPALGGPGLDEREAGLGVVEVLQVAFKTDDELGLGELAVIEVTFHERRVEAEVGGGEQADGAGALQVAVELEQVGRRRVVLVHLHSSIGSWSDAPT